MLRIILLLIISISLSACSASKPPLSKKTEPTTPPLAAFKINAQPQACFDRKQQPHRAVTDLHLHPQPFAGGSIPYPFLMNDLRTSGVRFALLYGIGQTLPYHHECINWLKCPGVPVTPSIRNDFENAANFLEYPQEDIHISLAMTFPDLANPEEIVNGIHLLDAEYPGLFQWMGEVNVHKEALMNNQHEPATLEDIANWQSFMTILEERSIPLALHSDLGNDANPTQHLYLMQNILERYPNNKIVWMHMGLSNELLHMNPKEHIQVMSDFLDQHPNLYLDISWRIIAKSYFNTPEKRQMYAEFINQYPTRIIIGTDFVATEHASVTAYREEADITSDILQYINDEAFRGIALGQNYFNLLPGMNTEYQAPPICQ